MKTDIILPVLYFSLIYLIEVEGNLVVTPNGNYDADSGQLFTASVCLPAGSQPRFTLEYVSVSSSSVLFLIRDSQNGQQISGGSCQGSIHAYSYDVVYIDHPSLVGQSVKLRVTTQSPSFSAVSSGVITFNVLYSLSGSSTLATLGQDYTWTCDTSGEIPAGVPIMYICWYRGGYQSEQKVGCSGYLSGSCQTEDNDPRYTFRCNSTVYTLTIPGVNMDESNQKSIWRCVNGFRSIVTSPQYTSSFKELSIGIPVANVTLIPSSIVSMENVATTIQCLPNRNAYPQPTITWYKDDVDITSQATTDRKNMILSFTRTDHGKVLRCTVTGHSTTSDKLASINVIYPPSSDPVIIGYDGSPLQEGDGTITVTCRQEGGNPVANMNFVCQGNGGTVTPSGNTVTSSHTLTINRSLDKQTCTCTTSHPAGNYQRTVTREFIVYYPPQNPVLQPSFPYPWSTGDNRWLTCTTSGGNPTVYNYTWLEGTIVVHVGQQLNFPSLAASDNNRQMSCQVDNAYKGEPVRSDITALQVEYKPIVLIEPVNSTVIVGDTDVLLTCIVKNANPRPRSFSWMKGTSIICVSQNFSLLNVSRSDAGSYSCTATNVAGTSDPAITTVNVLYPPVIADIPTQTPEEGSKLTIECSILLSNPAHDRIYWTRTKDSTFRTEGRVLSITNITRQHTDIYTCIVENTMLTLERNVTGRSEKTVVVDVLCSPRPVENFVTPQKIVVGLDQDLNITLLYTGSPIPTVNWFYDVDKIANHSRTNDDLSVNEVSRIGIGLYKTSLTKFLTYDDFGNYVAVLQNSHGRAVVVYQVIRKGKPDPPTDLYVDCTVPNQANLSWTPGFNGLDENEKESQIFFILYRRQSDDSFTTHINEINDTGSRQSGIVGNLSPGQWIFSLMARNALGSITSSQSVPCTIFKSSNEGQSSFLGGSFGAGIGVMLALVVIIEVPIFLICYKRGFHSKTALQNMKADTKSERKEDGRAYEEIGRIEIPEVNYSQLNPTEDVMEYANTTLNGAQNE